MSRENLSPFLDRARRAAKRLSSADPVRLCAVMCSYDSAFDSVTDQVAEKIAELASVFPADGPVEVSVIVVDDTDQRAAFASAAVRGFERQPGLLRGRLAVTPLFYGSPTKRGQKGLALREGLLAGLLAGADVLVYLNLNLKVHAAQVAAALDLLLSGPHDAVVGSRHPKDGGAAVGRGALGDMKSAVWSGLVRHTFPELDRFLDQNAPLKMFRREAAQAVVRTARIDGVTLDSEWLCVLMGQGLSVATLPICWVQKRGSKIPFWAIGPMARDLLRLRRAKKRGAFGSLPGSARR